MKKIFYRFALAICLVGLVVCCGTMAYRYEVRQNAVATMKDIREETVAITDSVRMNTDMDSDFVESSTESAEGSNSVESIINESVVSDYSTKIEPVDVFEEFNISIPEKNIDWDKLHSQNPDIYAWIYIPDTNIDYPILQHPEEKSYYLNHNIDGSEGYPGCIYTQNVNKKDWTDPNTVIYGHNMNNGSMFHDLHKFEDAVFFDATKFLYIYTPEQNLVYEIFAAYPFTNIDLIMCFDYSTPEALLVYFDGIWTNRSMTSHFSDSITLYGDSRIITMSTCIGGQPEMRYLVQAVFLGMR